MKILMSLLPGLLVKALPWEEPKAALQKPRWRNLGLQDHLRRPEGKQEEKGHNQKLNSARALPPKDAEQWSLPDLHGGIPWGAFRFPHVLTLHSRPVKTKSLGTGPE